jgi:hypothetical protein
MPPVGFEPTISVGERPQMGFNSGLKGLIVNEGSEAPLRNPKATAPDFDQHTKYSFIDGFRWAASSNNQDKRYALK